MKLDPDNEDEVHDPLTHRDPDRNRITPLIRLSSLAATELVSKLAGIVRSAHAHYGSRRPDEDGVTRAQTFEEGDVYMIAKPFDEYPPDRYLMDFYNVRDRGICSRMHLHTGTRFVQMMTGPQTTIRVSSLSPFDVRRVAGVHGWQLDEFEDDLPDTPGGVQITRYNAIVPECSIVYMQVPRGTSHQFNAIGPYAVIDSVHPEESIEIFREHMSGLRMMAQTLFLAEDLPDSSTCVIGD